MSLSKNINHNFQSLLNLFREEQQAKNLPYKSTAEEIRLISRFNTLFIIFLTTDIIIRGFMSQYILMFSSIIIVTFLFIARWFNQRSQLETGSLIVGLGFYIAAVYHSYFTQELYVPYFILMMAPSLAAVIMRSRTTKFVFFGMSIILFFVCNLLVGVPLLANNLFFVGLIPPFFAMMYFYNKSKLLEEDKENLINELENRNNEMILFSQMMSHDLKAPLRSISGFSSLLKRQINKNPNSSDREKEYLQFILENTGNMQILIDDLMTYLKASADEYSLEEIDLDAMIDVQKLAFQLELQEGKLIIEQTKLGTVNGHRNALRTVFQNLMSNAVKYQPLDQPNHTPTIQIIREQKEDKLIIYLKDNGIWIKEEYLKELFTPFKRFHSDMEYKGTGLGLSICKKMLNRMGGDIVVKTAMKMALAL